jgi:hypothetical protein
VSLQNVSYAVRGGFADPGDAIKLRLPLFNYATNPVYARDLRLVLGILTTTTPGVRVKNGVSAYGRIGAGQIGTNDAEFDVRLDPTFVPGTPIELELTVVSDVGVAVLRHTLDTGTPVRTTLVHEDFESVTPGALPGGWTAAHGAGLNTVRWATTRTFCGASNGAFHANANDGPVNGSPARWERLLSPVFTVPPTAEYVEVDFDVCYDTENDPVLATTAYDGFFLRVADLTPGRTVRSVLVEAFADEFVTGDIAHYPQHLPRSGNPSYFEDMSAWGGSSGGLRHVHLRLPGMAGSTAQLRFEFTQDSFGTCTDVRPGSAACGVFLDNVVINSVVSAPAAPGGKDH